MFHGWKTRSVGSKIVLLVTLASATAVVLVTVVMLTQTLVRLRQVSRGFMISEARMYSVHLAAPLAFDDPQAAEETLQSLTTVPYIVVAKVFDADGDIFANLHEAQGMAPISASVPLGLTSRGRYILAAQPIDVDKRRIGTVVLVYDTTFLNRKAMIDSLIAVLIAGVAIAFSMLLALRLRRTITAPVDELINTARKVSGSEDYSARATKISDDEFGDLTQTFNEMLGRIQLQADAIREANAELRASNEEMEQFVYTVSHDLKSPLVTISGFTGLLREDMKAGSEEDIADSLTHIEKASHKMGALIEDLLQLSRVGRMQYHLQWVDVHDAVAEVVANLDHLIEERQATISVADDIPPVWADRQRFLQLWQNLIENALKYGCPSLDQCVEIGGRTRGDAIELFIRDHGPGIAPQYQDRVFGLFQRLAASDQPGTGIGLTIAKRIVEAHQGTIRIESKPEQGCIFTVAFPLPAGIQNTGAVSSNSNEHP